MREAKDEKCTRCNKQATVFVGLADPDATAYPMCDKHASEWQIEVYLMLADLHKEEDAADN